MSRAVEKAKLRPPSKSSQREWTTPPKYADELGVSCEKVIGFIVSGELPAINIASNVNGRPRYLINLEDAAHFEKSRRVVPNGVLSSTQRLRRKAAAGVTEYF